MWLIMEQILKEGLKMVHKDEHKDTYRLASAILIRKILSERLKVFRSATDLTYRITTFCPDSNDLIFTHFLQALLIYKIWTARNLSEILKY